MNIKKLPSYTDDEVKVFHPLCEKALNIAIENLNLSSELEIKHHESIGSIEADYVVVRKTTQKYILFVEVKRNPAAVSSTRYRLQAQSYVREAQSTVEKPYYAITNLEILDLFKHDASRLSVAQQIIEPSTIRIGEFSDDPNAFFLNLIKCFEQVLSVVINDQCSYKELTGSFIPMLEANKTEQELWHQSLVISGYEYIRGVLKSSNRKIDWKSASQYRNRPKKIVDNIQSLNFFSLSNPPFPVSGNDVIWDVSMLDDLGELGRKTMSGDAMAELIHSIAIAGREHEGLVPTDLELANILAILSRFTLNRDLSEDEIICDPAAGSGNLLASSKSGFENIYPKQLWANDKEKLFSELLSIRLGLMFPSVISPQNSPKITDYDVVNLHKEDFDNVKIVMMNPPYVSGVKDPITKHSIGRRIYDINNSKALTLIGQVGVEAPFLELINSLVKEGTVISVVFPKQYLTTNGREAHSFRQFLLNNFGLSLIFMYPRDGVFQEVVKDTVVLIGVKGIRSEKIKILKSQIPLADVNLTKLKQCLNNLKNNTSDLIYGVDYKEISILDLEKNIEKGWRNISITDENIEKWIEKSLNLNSKKLSEDYILKRGRIGNAGASDLLFINSNSRFWYLVESVVPESWLFPALRTVKQIDSLFLNSSTTDIRFFSPSDEAFTIGTKEYDLLDNILNIYLKFQNDTFENTKQRKKMKTKEELRKIINKERKKITDENTILIPRNIRRFARVFMTTERAYISTNVIEVKINCPDEVWLIQSWLMSVYSQLQFEGMAKDQEGTRKLEESSIGELLIPKFEDIQDEMKKRIINSSKENIKFLDLCRPVASNIDQLWSNVFSEPLEIVAETVVLLEEKVAERFPEYSVE